MHARGQTLRCETKKKPQPIPTPSTLSPPPAESEHAPDHHLGRAPVPSIVLHDCGSVLAPLSLVHHSGDAPLKRGMELHLVLRSVQWDKSKWKSGKWTSGKKCKKGGNVADAPFKPSVVDDLQQSPKRAQVDAPVKPVARLLLSERVPHVGHAHHLLVRRDVGQGGCLPLRLGRLLQAHDVLSVRVEDARRKLGGHVAAAGHAAQVCVCVCVYLLPSLPLLFFAC